VCLDLAIYTCSFVILVSQVFVIEPCIHCLINESYDYACLDLLSFELVYCSSLFTYLYSCLVNLYTSLANRGLSSGIRATVPNPLEQDLFAFLLIFTFL